MEKERYLSFKEKIVDGELEYHIWNNKMEELGYIQRTRVGAWISWCLYLYPLCYLSASCLDEVREKIKELNGGQNAKRIKR